MNDITNPKIENYCVENTSLLPDYFQALKAETQLKTTAPQMQVGYLEGAFLKMLVSLTGATRILEFGTFTGFSSLAMAEALPENGKIITCDIDPHSTEIAQNYWKKSPHGHKIELRLGPGLDTVAQLKGPFDLVFIDADKGNYIRYWEACLPLVKKGGLLVVDNVLWSGKVLEPRDESDRHIVAFNKHAIQDKRVETVMLPVRDGMLLARKIN